MACIVSCLDQNDLQGEGLAFRHVTSLERGSYPFVKMSFLSISCLHCGDAPCMMVCPTKALYKRDDDGIVEIDRDLCVGCHSCALACPFGAPQYPSDGKMNKCNFCLERLDHDMEPACARVCPTRALGFGPMETLAEQKAERASISILDSLHVGPLNIRL
jgi:Fe-S-cluster-containing dehydrogenase component